MRTKCVLNFVPRVFIVVVSVKLESYKSWCVIFAGSRVLKTRFSLRGSRVFNTRDPHRPREAILAAA